MRLMSSRLSLVALLLMATSAVAASSTFEPRGTWSASTKRSDPSTLNLQLQQGPHRNMGFTEPLASFQGLSTTGGATTFTLPREAGTFRFDGQFQDGQGAGHFRFEASSAFLKTMATLGYSDITPEAQFQLAATNVTTARIQALAALGYKQLSTEELIQAGIFDVTPKYVRGLSDAGYPGLSFKELVAGRIHGVTPDFVKQLRELGFTDLTQDQLLAFRIHGVTPDFVKQMRESGYPNVTPDELVALRIHGIDRVFIRDMSGTAPKKK
ncbi:4-hydroxy-3-methylbut-2-enyl diphosphate reductase [Myxococcus sp. SDU36]|uniref:4-hydroxy-3-methylbut-2-enyl diphosphate reductase n=1 Tax=Myxococcus sp. SDU36 TaxID=2831967 RepID=UPI002542D81B|nr:4-hydroxy-3-methylbut-2-enyl diphosphate reductase [Myxococcus sp. SDU36]WIG94270.1 GPI anchored serine-threonine rich family protein [Myxococcus sp. SDU36]